MRVLPSSALALLACPVCQQPLVQEDAAGTPLIRCTGCGRGYPIVDDLPVLIASRAVS
jgi:uncharacterized protein YbaR (Trm112 family)